MTLVGVGSVESERSEAAEGRRVNSYGDDDDDDDDDNAERTRFKE